MYFLINLDLFRLVEGLVMHERNVHTRKLSKFYTKNCVDDEKPFAVSEEIFYVNKSLMSWTSIEFYRIYSWLRLWSLIKKVRKSFGSFSLWIFNFNAPNVKNTWNEDFLCSMQEIILLKTNWFGRFFDYLFLPILIIYRSISLEFYFHIEAELFVIFFLLNIFSNGWQLT